MLAVLTPRPSRCTRSRSRPWRRARPPCRGTGPGRRCAARTCGRRPRSCARRSARRAGSSAPRVELLEDLEDAVDHQRREAERRLVEQEQLGARHERARDRELLLLAAGELARRTCSSSAAGPGSARARADVGSDALAVLRTVAPILRFSPTVRRAKIRRPSGTSAMPRRRISSGGSADDRRAVEQDVARDRRERARDRHQGRRLAGAVVADEADELALVDLEREALDRGDAPVADRDVLELSTWCSCASFAPLTPRYAAMTSGSVRISSGEPRASVRRSRAPGSARRRGR